MGGCIEWTGYRDRQGYGQRGRNTKVHREAWEKAHGPIPEGMCVLHRCDNPPCYNVEHLYLGSRADNARDRHRKGRTRTWRMRLSMEDARTIRQRYARGGVTLQAIADEYHVTQSTVFRITSGRMWKEVPLG